MFKHIRLLFLLSLVFLLSNCERYVSELWQISNQSSENIQITVSDFNNNTTTSNSISPGSKITVVDINEANGRAPFVIENQEEVDIDNLVITNNGLQQMVRDPGDFENWNAEAVTDNIVEYILIVTDDDFN